MPFPLTEEQRRIVEDRGGELLVSAAAGSGKTRVLVERLLDRVTRENLDIDRFLVITYTRAAAAELRTRIAQELSARLALEPGNTHLRRQAALVYEAQISTIHAFCAAVLRESGHLVNLDPDFRLCDEGEAQVLMASTLEELLDSRYQGLQEDDPFARLVDTLSPQRDDSRLGRIVLDIFRHIQSHPDPERWLREQEEAWELGEVQDLSETAWGALLLQDVLDRCRWCRQQLVEARKLAEGDELLALNYVPTLSEGIRRLEELLQQRTWDEVYRRLPLKFPRAGTKSRRKTPVSEAEELRSEADKKRVKNTRDRCTKILEQVARSMEADSRTLLMDMSLSTPVVKALMELVRDFQRAFSAAKRRKNVVDFSDLEHLALKVLLDEEGNPSDVAILWQGRFAEVLVDEYQYTNQVQNAIFQAISDSGRQLFQVGDVKQSIYRFRLADPTIFLDKYRRYVPGEQALDGQPRRRILSRNFRSRREVLEGCNDLFRSIMSEELGEVDYTEDQALVPGASFPEGRDYALEADLLDLSFLKGGKERGEEGEEEEEKEDRYELEARFAARRIRELLDSGMLIGSGEQRRELRPSDIMILLRSPGRVQRFYRRALEEEGIPWAAEGGGSIFETTEVNVALAILQIVDNPHQDVALIAAMRSPVFGFSADRLAQLRSGARGQDFYTALVRAAGEEDGEDCRAFLAQLEELRFGAVDRTCRQLIWYVYEKTNLLGIFGAMDAREGEAGRRKGRERQENLLELYALAGQLEDAGCRTLFPFLLRLERLREAGREIVTPSAPKESGGVSILSIHRSKGLEKPVVLVCGLMKQFNTEDMKQPVLFHPRLGVGPVGLDMEHMVEYDTLARKAVMRQLSREMMAEEMRLLYVAMTRAQEKLILTMTLTVENQLEKLGQSASCPLSPQVLAMQSSVGQWVLLHLLTRPEVRQLPLGSWLDQVPQATGLGPAWDIRLVDGTSLRHPSRPSGEGRFADLIREGEEDAGALAEKLSWTYPHSRSTMIPSKVTATQLKGRLPDMEAAEEAVPVGEEPEREVPIMRPDFVAETSGLSPAQRGIALHQAMQYIPMDADHSVAGIRRVLKRLEEEKYLTPLQVRAVNPKMLSDFFLSPLGREMCQAKECSREFKFSLLVPASRYYQGADEEEEILLQGVVDAWFGDEQGVTVIDFKSDRISSGEEAARAEHYRYQLDIYSDALSKILGRAVKRRVLWFFNTSAPCEL